MPTAWIARWGTGKPVIAFGSDIDGIPKASQKPGVAYHDPMIEGAPGHGEGHNSGQAVNVTAALALKTIMEREKLPGTLVLWPGVAEELLAGKAYMVRDGHFKDVDAVLFTHVGDNLDVAWGQPNGTGMISVEYTFKGESAHSAARPWRGRSALDAVELMNIGWNFRREHLEPEQRSHYVIKNGGDQPNVVPSLASVWYFIREMDAADIEKNFGIANRMAEAATMMTDTTVSRRIIGSAWPRHFNKIIAETMNENITAVGLPKWSEDDQALAKGVQRTVKVKERGLATELEKFKPPVDKPESGGSDDIGDISWAVPTVTLRYPSNIPDLPGHHWANAISMATPIAHKGATAGAKVMALTTLDLLFRPELITEAWAYYKDVQTKEVKYKPFISADDKPATYINADVMAQYRPEMKKLYYNPVLYPSYLEQLGIKYPTLEKAAN
ncbi:aminobenzoyl-glutamate utilization protein B [Skermanella aerolata]|uniref:M20/M25/M40 family metallo-hydrolase n=1 Tax=Skermanella aerolata TaxID=393310 RepID=UPI003D203258